MNDLREHHGQWKDIEARKFGVRYHAYQCGKCKGRHSVIAFLPVLNIRCKCGAIMSMGFRPKGPEDHPYPPAIFQDLTGRTGAQPTRELFRNGIKEEKEDLEL